MNGLHTYDPISRRVVSPAPAYVVAIATGNQVCRRELIARGWTPPRPKRGGWIRRGVRWLKRRARR